MLRLLIALVLLCAPAANALETPPAASPRATVRLLSDVAAVAPGQPFRVALDQVLTKGWHTYWSNPGDAGAPPEVTWQLPDGATATPLQFPAPHRIQVGPLVNFGYENDAAFLTTITPPSSLRPGDTFSVVADANWLVCERICVPEEARFVLDFPVEAQPKPAPGMAARFAAAEAALPLPSPFRANIGFDGSSGAITIAGKEFTAGSVRDAFFFPADPLVIDNAARQALSVGDGVLRLDLARAQGALPGTMSGVITLTDGQGVSSAFLVSAVPGAVPGGTPGEAAREAAPALWQVVLLAALGGILLNLMPCVFPILAMKAAGLARLSGEARGTIRAHAASYAAGVVATFLVIGGGLLALRTTGSAVGWGLQFTSPVFVVAMAWLMLAVALNLSGVFGIGGPVQAGSGLASRGGHAGSFFTGGLAVLVATPCTAPFMATALGAAMAMPPAATLAVFAALGIGMALPYGMLGVFPGAARVLPRPGAWMERLKQGLAFPMYGAAAWLVWVLSQLAGADGVAIALAGAVMIAAAAWAIGLAQQGGRAWLGRGVAAAAILGAIVLLPRIAAAPPPETIIGTEAAWSPSRVEALRAEGRPVFVNMTAAWCISCKVNERVALSTSAVRDAFAKGNVAVLTGDWTRGDGAITDLLRQHGRAGVPLYLLYPAGGGSPVVLPQILTEGIMLRAIAGATTS